MLIVILLVIKSVTVPQVDAPPEPPTSILIVPFGPRLDLMTSCRPFAALMFMKRAAPRPMTSALGLRVFTDVIA